MSRYFIETTAFRRDIAALVSSVKRDIRPDYRAYVDSDTPGLLLTVACDNHGATWNWQTGDNSYTGPVYGLPHWAVVGVYPDSDPDDIAAEISDQLAELLFEVIDDGLAGFARYTLRTLTDDREWSVDTLDTIANYAIERGLAVSVDGFFRAID